MIDLYGLGPGFPGMPVPAGLTNIAKVWHMEQAFKDDICAEFPDLRPDVRLIPYFQLHEYEGLLFSDPAAFANGINQSQLVYAGFRVFAKTLTRPRTLTTAQSVRHRNAS